MEKKAVLTDTDTPPWHDTNGLYIATALFALGVLLFSLAGVSVANGDPGFASFVWVPWLLAAMSLVILLSSMARLLRRIVSAFRERRSLKGNGIPL